MPQLLLILTLSVAGFSPLESFLLAPNAGAACLNPGPVSRTSSATSVFREEGAPSRATRTLDERWSRRYPCSKTLALSATPSETGGLSDGGGGGGEQDVSDDTPSQQRQRKKRPRKHVPVLENVIDGEQTVGDPWVGLTTPKSSSSLPEPSQEERQRFGRVMEDVLAAEKEEELPATLTKHIDFLLSVDVTRLTNDLIRREPTLNRVQTLHNAYDFIVTFLEGMVESTVGVQKENQNLLREIIEVAKIGPSEFESKMKKLQSRFTFEFVKYLETEVERLEEASKKSETPGGDEVLNVMKIVRTRVCAQVDLMMGEDVAILTRMLSYNDRYMMRAALRAVFRDKKPEAVDAFSQLVSSTLKDVAALGTGVDPVLRCKLADMADDLVTIKRDVRDRKEEKAAEEAEAA